MLKSALSVRKDSSLVHEFPGCGKGAHFTLLMTSRNRQDNCPDGDRPPSCYIIPAADRGASVGVLVHTFCRRPVYFTAYTTAKVPIFITIQANTSLLLDNPVAAVVCM